MHNAHQSEYRIAAPEFSHFLTKWRKEKLIKRLTAQPYGSLVPSSKRCRNGNHYTLWVQGSCQRSPQRKGTLVPLPRVEPRRPWWVYLDPCLLSAAHEGHFSHGWEGPQNWVAASAVITAPSRARSSPQAALLPLARRSTYPWTLQ